jgi:ABC-2 type transport system ATP-binding protein
MIVLDNISRTMGNTAILRNISSHITPGSVVALLGKNGSGKSTLLSTMLGFTPATAGHCRLFGVDSTNLTPKERQRIGFVPQHDFLLSTATALQQIQLFQQFQPHWDHDLCAHLLREWQIPVQQEIRQLSQGQQQKLAIILALCHRPELLVLDEPVASLDPLARQQFLQQLMDIVSASADTATPVSVIFSSHIVSDLEQIASHVWLLKDGQLWVDSELDQLKESVAVITVPTDMVLPELPNIKLLRDHQFAGQRHLTVWQQQPGALEHACALLQTWLPTPLSQHRMTPKFLSLEGIFLEFHA